MMEELFKKAIKECVFYIKVTDIDAQDAVQNACIEFLARGESFTESGEFKRRFLRRSRELAWNIRRNGVIGSALTRLTKLHFIPLEDKLGVEDFILADTLSDEGPTPEEKVISNDLLNKLYKLAEGIGDESCIMHLRGTPVTKVAESFGVDRDTVYLRYADFTKRIILRAKNLGIGF